MEMITAEELDKKFDNDEDVSEYMDFSKAKKFNSFFEKNQKAEEQISLSFPKEFIEIIDNKIKEIGVNREAFIKMIVAQQLGIFARR